MKRLLSLIIAAVLVTAATLTMAVGPAFAEITVNETADELNADGDCSLREAVETLNTGAAVDGCAMPVDHVVTLPAGTFAVDDNLDVEVDATFVGEGKGVTSLSCENVPVNACIRLINPNVHFAMQD